jgi:hypothetical protein
MTASRLKARFTPNPLCHLGPSFDGNMNAARIDRHWPTELSKPRAVARWDWDGELLETHAMML